MSKPPQPSFGSSRKPTKRFGTVCGCDAKEAASGTKLLIPSKRQTKEQIVKVCSKNQWNSLHLGAIAMNTSCLIAPKLPMQWANQRTTRTNASKSCKVESQSFNCVCLDATT
eukprot:5357885-Amphidinium_carterae.1